MSDTLLFIIFMVVTLAQIAVVIFAYLETRRGVHRLHLKQMELDEVRQQFRAYRIQRMEQNTQRVMERFLSPEEIQRIDEEVDDALDWRTQP